jgi:hypothetical protein
MIGINVNPARKREETGVSIYWQSRSPPRGSENVDSGKPGSRFGNKSPVKERKKEGEMRVKLFVSGLALAVAAWLLAPSAVVAQDNEHYACYQAKASGASKVKPKPSGNIIDQVSSGAFSGCKLKLLCVPTDKNGSGIQNSNLHYCGWQCKGFKGSAPYTVTDQFVGGGGAEAKKLKFILNQCDKS